MPRTLWHYRLPPVNGPGSLRHVLGVLGLPPQVPTLWVAASAGADSTALLHWAVQAGYPVRAVHIHHGLRPEADAEAQFIAWLAADLGITAEVHRVDVAAHAAAHLLSTQMAARQLRYQALATALAQVPGSWCLTAHHLHDQAETLLYRLLRSHAYTPWRGIPARRGAYLRPLLGTPKSTPLEYLEREGLPWMEDASNATTHYTRNYLRHEVIPALLKVNPALPQHLCGLAAAQAQQRRALAALMPTPAEAQISENEIMLAPNIQTPSGGQNLHHSLQKLWLRQALARRWQLQGHAREQVLGLAHAQKGRSVTLHGWHYVREADRLVRQPLSPEPAEEALPLTGPGSYAWNGWHLHIQEQTAAAHATPAHVLLLDPGALQGTLHIRPWQAADRYQPLGMHGTQKVSDLLTNRKVPHTLRSHAWVLADGAGVVYAVGGRIAHRLRITEGTLHMWHIRLEAPPGLEPLLPPAG